VGANRAARANTCDPVRESRIVFGRWATPMDRLADRRGRGGEIVTNIPNPRAAIVEELTTTGTHIRRITDLADDSVRAAVTRYVGAILDAQLRLRRELAGVQNG